MIYSNAQYLLLLFVVLWWNCQALESNESTRVGVLILILNHEEATRSLR